MWRKLLLLASAGALGTLVRYALAGWVQRGAGAAFPWGTLAVNAAGCFLAGLVWMLAEHRMQLTGETRAIVLIGFLGAFTTFSAFMLETSELVRDAEWLRAAANVAIMNGVGLVALFAGLFAGRAW
ncbi:MAG TPA: CrcB family protein [Candidatus Hydrogenedentes bacterium]|nr:CrcB family protein [Candidatus Hydrogenedentota bacterium]HNT86712.1 CrcB family protein [Candidatus Hydrogenedentota bacterium]